MSNPNNIIQVVTGTIVPQGGGWAVWEGEDMGWCFYMIGEDALYMAREARQREKDNVSGT